MSKIEENRQKFINELNKLSNERKQASDINSFIDLLDKRGFFNAPATSQYKYSYDGGLCAYCLEMLSRLRKLVDLDSIKEDSIIICGLLSNVSKYDLYEKDYRNVKVRGTAQDNKTDEIGKYHWESKEYYKVKDSSNRFVLGDVGMNSYYIVSTFIPLTIDETSAFINFRLDTNRLEQQSVYGKYPLVSLVHSADIMTMYLPEE